MDIKTAAQIAGFTDYRNDGPADHPITPDERAMAIEVAYEMDARYGIDLAAHIEGQDALDRRLAHELGFAADELGFADSGSLQ